MPLDKSTLTSALETAFGANDVSDASAKSNIQSMAAAVADAIDVFVKSGDVNTTLSVNPHTPGGSATGTGTGSVT